MTPSTEQKTSQATPKTGDEATDFIRTIVAEDVRQNRYGGRVVTRFPPEPNGFLHIGHAKSICLNFGVAMDFGGHCNLRMDDTNPATEDISYVEAIQRDLRWLGFEWGDQVYYASDYYEQLYGYAVQLIKDGKAYVDSLNEEEIRAYRGTVMEAGRESPYRNRSVAENLDLLARMRAGEFADGAHVLRGKIDMAAANMKMRDPLLYRIRHAHHYRTGNLWCIYPMYDFAHPLSDAIEGVTHSICTLEFENNREIYDWLMESTQAAPWPNQYEFARLNLDYTVLSKRKLLQLVMERHVDGWDDPRMPTIAGLRRRGVTPDAIRTFAEMIGVAKTNSRVEISLFDHCIRDDLNFRSPRVMAVLRPLKLVIDNYPAEQEEELEASYWPRDVPKEGSRRVPFSRELYIEQDDFMEFPPDDFYRLAPGREIRLRFGYIVKCVDVVKDSMGKVLEVHCTYDPETKGGGATKGRRVQTIHWVSARQALPAEVRLYDRLFTVADPDDVPEDKSFRDYLNPYSKEVLTTAYIEPSVANDPPGMRYQFERLGYFISDIEDARPDRRVYNRIIELRDPWVAKRDASTESVQNTPVASAAAKKVAANVSSTENRRNKNDAREAVRAATPELAMRLTTYSQVLGLSAEDADLLSSDLALALFFEDALAAYDNAKSVANWVTNEVLREAKESSIAQLPIQGRQVGALAALVDGGDVTPAMAKEVFAIMLRTGADPMQIVREQGLEPIRNAEQLMPFVEKVIMANPEKVAQFRSGRNGLLGFFVGQVMRETANRAEAKLVQEMVQKALQAES